ncbi:hypothetical protein IW140_002365 [Coemansia sp. RSA 1813]|nr:hypothetical protein LPJ74_002011 [Coemansia sp. RSA 1843]KAJ2216048.1 hypothetical protein EV179_001699 [Coemansia sp. RSA 487]KAJ2570465.1 hypothetical protein IW140_002365 [Coemansia sp. RSA 1813]
MSRIAIGCSLAQLMGLNEVRNETQTAVRKWALQYMRTSTRSKDPTDAWHLSVSMRQVWSDPIFSYASAIRQLHCRICGSSDRTYACDYACSDGCVLGKQLALALEQTKWYIEHAHYSAAKCVLFIRLNHRALMGAFMECASAVGLGLHLYGAEPFPTRIFKWINTLNTDVAAVAATEINTASTRVSEYRSALVANVLAHVAAELSQISGYGLGPEHLEVLRGRGLLLPQDAMRERRLQGRVYGRQFASLHLAKMFAALDQLNVLHRDPSSLSLYMQLPGYNNAGELAMADSDGRASDMACDACVVFMQMLGKVIWFRRQSVVSTMLRAERSAKPDGGMPLLSDADELENDVVWYHVVPDSRCRLYWEQVMRIAELACKGSGLHNVLRIRNIVCNVGGASIDKRAIRSNDGEKTHRLLEYLGLIGKSDRDDRMAESSALLNKAELRALQLNMHCGMLKMASRKGLPYKLEPLENRRLEGSFLLNTYSKLCKAVRGFPQAQKPDLWSSVLEAMGTAGIHVQLVAHLAAQLPEILRRTLAAHRPEILVEYFVRLAHAAAKCIYQFGQVSATLSVDEAESWAHFLAAIKLLLGLGIRTMGCNPDDDNDVV